LIKRDSESILSKKKMIKHLTSKRNLNQAYAWSRTRMGGWAVAQSPTLRTTITIARMKKKGYVSLIDYYKKSKRIIIEPLPKAFGKTRTLGGVRGELRSVMGGAVYSIGLSFYLSSISKID